MPITLSQQDRQQALSSIKKFFDHHLEQEIGDLKASLVLEFCLREIGPSVYNRAIADAQAFMHDRVSDLEGSCYEAEFGYWAGRGASQ
jgi:uncharacterized protein (DUF2164 family)